MSELCGAWGGCVLPVGHNMGRLDIPENHQVGVTRNQMTEMMVDAYCRRYHHSDDPVRDHMEDVLDVIEPIICAQERDRTRGIIEELENLADNLPRHERERLLALVKKLPAPAGLGVEYLYRDSVIAILEAP
jgi:hypothetical protein